MCISAITWHYLYLSIYPSTSTYNLLLTIRNQKKKGEGLCQIMTE